MTTEVEPTESVFFFPLRSNVGYFDTPQEYLSLIGRIKQASLLYDYLVFEEGIYTATVWDSGVFDYWMPPDKGKRLANIIKNDLEGYFNEIGTPINQFLKSKMVSNLSHDLAIISGMQAP